MDCGTFLLLQSPSGQNHAEVFARATEMTQAADRLGFDSVWCAEHHFSMWRSRRGCSCRPCFLRLLFQVLVVLGYDRWPGLGLWFCLDLAFGFRS